MKVIFAKRKDDKALYELATASNLGEACRIAQAFRLCSPDGWLCGVALPLNVMSQPSPEVFGVLEQWTDDALEGKVNAEILAIRAEEAKRHARRAALVASGRYTWSDFDIADDGDDEEADEE